MAGTYSINDARRPPLPPYLGPWALASLAFTSPIILSLLLVIMRLVLAINSANASIESAKVKLASSCLGLEQSASVAVSFPHYLADNVNKVTADGAEAIVHGLATVLDMSVLAIEQILIFVVDMYRSMYLCLADLVVRGGLALAIGATQEFSEFFNNTVATIKTDLQDAVNVANSALDGAIDVINRIPGVDVDAPSFNPNLDFLNNVGIPDDFLNALVGLNDSLPTLDELKQKMNGVIAIPFEALRTDIKTDLGNATFDRTLFPVPDKEQMAFCQGLDYSFVDDVGHSLVKVAQYGIIIIVVLIILYISAMVFLERRRFAGLAEYIERCREEWASDMGTKYGDNYNYGSSLAAQSFNRDDVNRVLTGTALLGFLACSQNTLLRSYLPKMMNRIPRLRQSPRARSNITWFAAYITYLPALLLLAVSLFGLLTIEVQLAALKPTEKTAQEQVNNGLDSFKDDILARINSASAAKSLEFAQGSNAVIMGMQNGVNDNMFGWVNTTTVTINTTINEFYTGLTGAIDSTFHGTVFETPALGVIQCLIGSKIEALSIALTWLHDNAHLTLPLVSNDIFTLSPDKSDELVSSLDGSDPNDPSASSSLVQTFVGEYRKALEKERVMFLAMLGLYGLVILFGLFAILWNEVLGPKWSSRNGRSGNTGGIAGGLKELELEKNSAITYPVTSSFEQSVRNGGNQRRKWEGVTARIGQVAAVPMAWVRKRPMKRRGARSSMTSITNVSIPSASYPMQQSATLQRTFSPPPAYHKPGADGGDVIHGQTEAGTGITHFPSMQESTVSLLGALNLPDTTESRQSIASVQPSSAGVSPNMARRSSSSSLSSAFQAVDLQTSSSPPVPQVPLSYLYGHGEGNSSKQQTLHIPVRPLRTPSIINPFLTPFDGPNGT